MSDFSSRHIGIQPDDQKEMLEKIGCSSLQELIQKTIPEDIHLTEALNLAPAMTEGQFAEHIQDIASKNKCFTSYIGSGWYDTFTPAVIQRNVFENPSWYTSYTPYQAEISQGRLEALLNFQTVITELTGLPLTNASMLDDSTCAAEAANLFFNLRSREQEASGTNTLFVDRSVFAQTQSVLYTRCIPQGIQIEVGEYTTFNPTKAHFAAIVQYPNADGQVDNLEYFIDKMHQAGLKVAVGADLLSLCLLQAPGTWGADVVYGSSQRFGIPMGFGGPAAGYFATKDEYKRSIPGRIIGISKDKNGMKALRLALQTREQHIKREKATSNICTATALMASMAGFYAVYHGYEGLLNIAKRIHGIASYLNDALAVYGYKQLNDSYFDTLKIKLPATVKVSKVKELALEYDVNFRYFESGEIGISIDETTDVDDVDVLLDIFASAAGNQASFTHGEDFSTINSLDDSLLRKDKFLQEEVFKAYRSETDMMRYIKKLERKDISLTHSMISLGSCTMKLNAASEMLPLSLAGFMNIHPYAPADQVEGYLEMISNFEKMLTTITGFAGCSVQPNSGAAGEYAGLRVIREYFNEKKETQRKLILIPSSAHGTNPASAIQAGFDILTVACDEKGNVDINDWTKKATDNAAILAGCMITYPSTHGIFEKQIRLMCDIIHQQGGQVYMDGANMNAQVGITSPGFIGADICHLNLHKTFAMPHGGGGPGVGPICCASHLVKFLPGHPHSGNSLNTVASAPYGSAMMLPVSYGYICMLGAEGAKNVSEIAILSANFLAESLKDLYPVLFRGESGCVGHEVILDCRGFKNAGISETDIAKRLMDFGFHAPTLSFPVHGTLMIEPTESESLAELKRFIETMTCIYKEIKEIENGEYSVDDNVLIQAPHAEYELTADEWNHAYSRSKAGFPLPWIREKKFQLSVARVDNAWGDRNLICSCQQ
ncbi:MAG TPA: aminomethyl-transferring glycine dehydrogenase [Bacteroidales bacterium]|nr:aminomethyl-transferring glycine dehydrogenase [Bacteroidales bacterium]